MNILKIKWVSYNPAKISVSVYASTNINAYLCIYIPNTTVDAKHNGGSALPFDRIIEPAAALGVLANKVTLKFRGISEAN